MTHEEEENLKRAVRLLVDKERSWRPILAVVVFLVFTFMLIHLVGGLQTRLDVVEKELRELHERLIIIPPQAR